LIEFDVQSPNIIQTLFSSIAKKAFSFSIFTEIKILILKKIIEI